jgi:hypothetical protein
VNEGRNRYSKEGGERSSTATWCSPDSLIAYGHQISSTLEYSAGIDASRLKSSISDHPRSGTRISPAALQGPALGRLWCCGSYFLPSCEVEYKFLVTTTHLCTNELHGGDSVLQALRLLSNRVLGAGIEYLTAWMAKLQRVDPIDRLSNFAKAKLARTKLTNEKQSAESFRL